MIVNKDGYCPFYEKIADLESKITEHNKRCDECGLCDQDGESGYCWKVVEQ